MHCILESTFCAYLSIFRTPFLQEVQFYRENLFPVESALMHPKGNGSERRGAHCHYMLLYLNSACESSHPQCSKNKEIRTKVDSESLYGKGTLLFMGFCTCSFPSQQELPFERVNQPRSLDNEKGSENEIKRDSKNKVIVKAAFFFSDFDT